MRPLSTCHPSSQPKSRGNDTDVPQAEGIFSLLPLTKLSAGTLAGVESMISGVGQMDCSGSPSKSSAKLG